ncbi:MAG: type I-D CRISPR-associated endonuclease Cas1 [bacterium]|nr:type I-D CRISPR-associated endonuclease Cas1 [bacterium]
MSTLYITQQDATLRKTDERLRVTVKKDVLLDVPMLKISQIVLYGRITVTAATVAALMERKIEICYLTQRGKYIGRLQPEFSKNSLLRKEQYRAAFDPQRSLELSRKFVLGKLLNMRTWLMRMNRKLDNAEIEAAVNRIKRACDGAKDAKDVAQARGHEGEGSAAYFSVFQHLLRKSGFDFPKRVRRPPTDPVNSLLSFGYTLLTNELFSAVNVVGFDPYVGYLHAERYGRASLPLDLIEEFRPVIVDSVVVSTINNDILKPDDFCEEMGGVFKLNDAGRKKFLMQYEDRKNTEFKHPILNQKTSYQGCFEQQARFLAKTLMGELDEYPPLLIK